MQKRAIDECDPFLREGDPPLSHGGANGRRNGIRRFFLSCIVCVLILGGGWYLLAFGWPFPGEKGKMFYEWRLGERGWAYWFPATWSDECNNKLIMDFSRNLIAFGPPEAIESWEPHKTYIVFAVGSPQPVRIEECQNRLFVIGRSGHSPEFPVSAGSAARLRRALRASDSTDLQAILQSLVPEIADTLKAMKESGDISSEIFDPLR